MFVLDIRSTRTTLRPNRQYKQKCLFGNSKGIVSHDHDRQSVWMAKSMKHHDRWLPLDGGSLRERNPDRHRSALVGLSLDYREHGENNSGERTLDLDLLRWGIELEVFHQFRDEGLHLYEPGKDTCRYSQLLASKVEGTMG